MKELSKELTTEFGKGFSRSNLQNMRAFYLAYQKCQSVTGKFSWTHYIVPSKATRLEYDFVTRVAESEFYLQQVNA